RGGTPTGSAVVERRRGAPAGRTAAGAVLRMTSASAAPARSKATRDHHRQAVGRSGERCGRIGDRLSAPVAQLRRFDAGRNLRDLDFLPGGRSVADYIYTLRNVRKAHGDKVVLDNVTLSFLPGAKIGVVG